ncbi:MAG TPA: hypothetical protein DCE56_19760 [Cyanobacteria bacterium UBA8553]|nr:hypothetical protein [Cyanobacteria bacterium UBA8553]HAJ64391.1 hypothetical protein [Cyanobacteria bacterium UBA8543]
MTQTLIDSQDSLVSQCDRSILCCHINTTHKIQLIRIRNIPDLHFERVIFPGQRLMFEALPEAKLEICTSPYITLVVRCQNLRVSEVFTPEKALT